MARTPKKTTLILNHIDNNVGAEYTVQQIATVAECTIQNVYVFIRNNPDRFESLGKGLYRILSAQKYNQI
jgi:hypothetical protein